MTTADYLTQLQQDREDLIDNLETKGITGLTGDETFTELVPEVLNIPSGGGVNLDDYFITTPSANLDVSDQEKNKVLIKQFPTMNMTNRTTISDVFSGYPSLVSLPTMTNTTNITSAFAMALNCPALVNVPYYSMPNCRDFDIAFSDSTLLSNQSIQNIMQMLINCDNENYESDKWLTAVISDQIPNLESKVMAMSNYQDFLNAGWTIFQETVNIDGEDVEVDFSQTFAEQGYESLYSQETCAWDEDPEQFSVLSEYPERGGEYYSNCEQEERPGIRIDGEDVDIDYEQTFAEQGYENIYSQETCSPEEDPEDFNVTNDYPEVDTDYYTSCTPEEE